MLAVLFLSGAVAAHHGAPTDMHAMPAAMVCLAVMVAVGAAVVAVGAAFVSRGGFAPLVLSGPCPGWHSAATQQQARAGPLFLRLQVLRL
jgi:hypothetical protein